MSSWSKFARWTADACGKPGAFLGAVVLILIWGACGPLLGFSNTWQLLMNTFTTIVTFLMVFLLQHTQNADSEEVKERLKRIEDQQK